MKRNTNSRLPPGEDTPPMLKIADPNAEMGLTLDEIAREGA